VEKDFLDSAAECSRVSCQVWTSAEVCSSLSTSAAHVFCLARKRRPILAVFLCKYDS